MCVGGNSVETLDRGRFSERKGPRNQYGIMGDVEEQQKYWMGKFGRLGRFCWLAGWPTNWIESGMEWREKRPIHHTIPAEVYDRRDHSSLLIGNQYFISCRLGDNARDYYFIIVREVRRRGRGVIVAGPVCTLIEKQDVIRGIIRSLI